MKFPQLNLKGTFEHHLAVSGIQQPPSQVKAECLLLRQRIESALEKEFDSALKDTGFSRDFAEVINRSPQRIDAVTYESLLDSLAKENQALVLMRPHQKGDVVWQGKGTAREWRDYVRPMPVRAHMLQVPPRRIHYRVTRDEIAVWQQAATFIPTSSLEALMRFRDKDIDRIRAIVADRNGVVVIFNVVAHDYQSWRKSTMKLWDVLTANGVAAKRFTLGRIVPISRESRGRGAVLYLA